MLMTLWRGIMTSNKPSWMPRDRRGMRRTTAIGSSLCLEALERRNLLAVVAALSDANELVQFDTATPGTLLSAVSVSGLASGESLVGIDLRPANGLLYGVGSAGNLYTVDITTAAATFVAELTNGGNPLELDGTEFSVDFNPDVDQLRLTSDTDINWRIDVTTGDTTIDSTLLYGPSDPNEGADAGVSALAYTNNFAGATVTELFGIDSATDALVRLDSPNAGTLTTVGSLGIEVSAVNGFEILPAANVAIAALTANSITSLYTIDLQTGAATLVGAIDQQGATAMRGLSALPVDASPAGIAFGVNDSGDLVEFDPADPTVILDTTAITGILRGESIVAIDIRPSDGQLYALASDGTIYTIDTVTAAATEVSSLNDGANNLALVGSQFGIDFNPLEDALRITSNTGLNWRANVQTGLVTVDTPLDFLAGDENEGADPNIAAISYTDSFDGTSATELYGIDTALDVLVLIDPENGGSLTTVGDLGVDVTAVNGFDIRPEENEALAALTTDAGTLLYRIDLATGLATPLGLLGSGSASLTGLAFVSADAVNPGTVEFSAATYVDDEGVASILITVTRSGGTDGSITVDYTTSDGSASEGADYTLAAGTLTFADGEISKTFLVPILSDAAIEGNETVNLTLSNPTGGATLGAQASAVLTILDDDDDVEPPPGTNASFIENLYADVLDRASDPAGLQYWLAQMQLGAARADVAKSFFASTEYKQLFVNDVYQDYLGRSAEPTGLEFWVALMQGGASEASVEIGILSSQEFYDLSGGNDADFVDALYDRLLGREPDGTESQIALARLQNGNVTRAELAGEVSAGLEHLGLLVDDADDLETDGPSEAWYQDFLNRDADSGGLNFHTNSLFRGASRTDVQVAILASEEYFSKLAVEELDEAIV